MFVGFDCSRGTNGGSHDIGGLAEYVRRQTDPARSSKGFFGGAPAARWPVAALGCPRDAPGLRCSSIRGRARRKGIRPAVLRKDPNRRRPHAGSRSSSGSGHSRSPAGGNSSARGRRSGDPFVLYVEGARDREILQCWARRSEPSLARCIEHNTVILGGRRPARALSDFRRRGGVDAGLRGLVVLDRDDHEEGPESAHTASREAGLEVFVWGLRHIESYLLVPAALRRVLRVSIDDPRVDRALADQMALEDDRQGSGSESIHAKRILGAGGSLSEALGAELRAGEIARAMRTDDLHDDVLALFKRIGTLSGLQTGGPEVVIRPNRHDKRNP